MIWGEEGEMFSWRLEVGGWMLEVEPERLKTQILLECWIVGELECSFIRKDFTD